MAQKQNDTSLAPITRQDLKQFGKEMADKLLAMEAGYNAENDILAGQIRDTDSRLIAKILEGFYNDPVKMANLRVAAHEIMSRGWWRLVLLFAAAVALGVWIAK